MSNVFTWNPDFGAAKDVKPQVKQIKFGDGYEQRATFGLNTKPQNWNLRFTLRTQSETDAITGFFDSLGGVASFQWTPPDQSSPVTFVCRSWNKTVDKPGLLYSVTATFEQVFEP